MQKVADRILNNSFWYSIEMTLEALVFLGSSIAVARYLGPVKLGYFSYINFFVAIITGPGSTGLNTATRKYMSEFVAMGDLGTAHSVYKLTHRYQMLGAFGLSACGLLAALAFGDPAYRTMTCVMLVAIVPGLLSGIAAQANQAFEDVRKNTISAFGYLGAYLIVILLTLHFRWDLVGVASATLCARTVEALLRSIPLTRKLNKLPLTPLDAELIQRIRRFCFQAMGVQLIVSVVWDRSELFFLRAFSTLEQIGFYSISFSLCNNLLTPIRMFGWSTGVTLMVEASRDARRVRSIVRHATRYSLLLALPTCMGAAAIVRPLIGLVYGQRYMGAVTTLMVAVILCMPRAFQWIPDTLIRSADKQNYLFVSYAVTSVVNITLDFILIPRYGAVGAAWGNGLAQFFGIVLIWHQARRFYDFEFPKRAAIGIGLASAIMAVIAYKISHSIPGYVGIAVAIVTAILSLMVLLRLFRALEPSDRLRLAPIGGRLPGPAHLLFESALNLVIPAPLSEVVAKREHLYLLDLLMHFMGTNERISHRVYRPQWHSHMSRMAKWLYSFRYLPRAFSTRNKFLERGSRAKMHGQILLTSSRILEETLKCVFSLDSFIIGYTSQPNPVRSACELMGIDPADELECYISLNHLLVFFAQNSGLPVVVHVAGSPTGLRTLEKHRNGLELAGSSLLPAEVRKLIPEVLSWKTDGAFRLFTQTRLPGSPLAARDSSEEDLYRRIDLALEPLLHLRATAELSDKSADRKMIFEDFPLTLDYFADLQPWLTPLLSALQTWQQTRGLVPILTHGDYWLRNVLFDTDQTHASGIIDWERCRPCGTPGLDALQLLFMSLTMERNRNLTDLLVHAWSGNWESPRLASYVARIEDLYQLQPNDIGYLAAMLCFDEADKRRETERELRSGYIESLKNISPALNEWLQRQQ